MDLLLIQDIVGVPDLPTALLPLPGKKEARNYVKDDHDSASEAEIEGELKTGSLEESSIDSDSDSESDSESESNSGSISSVPPSPSPLSTRKELNLDLEEENAPTTTPGHYFTTKNEILEPKVSIPPFQVVDSDAVMEPVGEVLSVIADSIVVVKATSPKSADSALDTETLLVFEDRSVLGYIYDTFGPTSNPLYQVKFSTEFPLDLQKVPVGRKVFHLPRHSHYVSVMQLCRQKGSDASNLYDEEPAEHELEFSDDEAEAAHKSHIKKRRAQSMTPSLSDAQTHSLVGSTPFDAHSFYDLDSVAGPSSYPQSETLSYDDPYAEGSNEVNTVASSSRHQSQPDRQRPRLSEDLPRRPPRGNGRGRGRGRGRRNGPHTMPQHVDHLPPAGSPHMNHSAVYPVGIPPQGSPAVHFNPRFMGFNFTFGVNPYQGSPNHGPSGPPYGPHPG